MKFKNGFFILGTDTNIGKTYVASLLYKALKSKDTHYYKPVQTGCISADSKKIAPDVDFLCKFNNIDYDDSMVGYTLSEEVSPHLAADLEKVEIKEEKLVVDIENLKNEYTNLLIEGAGGLYVPLVRDKYFIYDLIKKLGLPVILVASTKIGTINHSILTINALKEMNIYIHGLIFNQFTGKLYEMDNIKNILSISKIDNYLIIEDKQNEIKEEDIAKFFGSAL